MFKFAVVITHATQHHGPMFRELAKTPGLELKVFFCSRIGQDNSLDPGFATQIAWDVPLTDGYEHEFLATTQEVKSTKFGDIQNPDLVDRLDDFGANAIWINGYGCKSYWGAAKWARKNGAAVLCFSDSELMHQRNFLKRIAKELVVRNFYQKCSAFLTVGDCNEDYYRHYGVEESRMVRGCYPIDVTRFEETLQNSEARRGEIRQELGIPDGALVGLFLGKMIDIKRPADLVRAIAGAASSGQEIHGLFLGNGVLLDDVKALSRELNVEHLTHFVGFVNQQQIPHYLNAADVITMCSEKDPHPLAVTESMIAGNAVVASNRIGCVGVTDTVRDGINAFVYECGDTNQIAELLIRLDSDRQLLHQMQAASRKIAKSQDKLVTVRAVLVAIDRLQDEFAESWSRIDSDVFAQFKLYSADLPTPEVQFLDSEIQKLTSSDRRAA